MKYLTDLLNDENRLIRVQGPGSVDISYSYDSIGRMLTRDDGGPDITQLTWHGWDCIKEVTGESETVYHIPEGVVSSFIRDGKRYELHHDALGSVRMITDESGIAVARYEYSGFGTAISVTEEPGVIGFPMRFVGTHGVRNDAISGLYYMRQRWYSDRLGVFLSRDPLGLQGSKNLTAYCVNNPVNRSDPSGLQPGAGYPVDKLGTMLRSKNLSKPLTKDQVADIWLKLKKIACDVGVPPALLIALWTREGSWGFDGRQREYVTYHAVKNFGTRYQVPFIKNGSMGIMQMSPSTAAYVDGEFPLANWPFLSSSERRELYDGLSDADKDYYTAALSNPETNIRYAAEYLKDLGKLLYGKELTNLDKAELANVAEWYNAGASGASPGTKEVSKHTDYYSDILVIMYNLRKDYGSYCNCD